MPVTDPIDARLLAALADLGKVPVHELAGRLGMDPREVAYRLVALSGSGLPLLVGVECDQQAIRAAVAGGYRPPPTVPPAPMRPSRPPAAPAPVPPDPVMSTWGPPQTSSWARGD